ncbi:MAG: phosphoribosylanthranilate isomerase [Candidatus Humimicrobiaceae bacterium]
MAKIKICGIKNFKDIECINEAQPDYIGFVFAKGKRYVDPELANLLKSRLNRNIHVIGVFVNEDIGAIAKLCDRNIIDIVQIHGDEDEAYIKALKKEVFKPIIKTIRVKEQVTSPIYDSADYVLFDTFSKSHYGGTGKSFDWNMIRGYKKPFFLAGGLKFGNVADAVNSLHPYCIDISSGVETDNIKDGEKIIKVVNLVRSLNK